MKTILAGLAASRGGVVRTIALAGAVLMTAGEAQATIVAFTTPVIVPPTLAGVAINLLTGQTTGQTDLVDLTVARNFGVYDCSGICFNFFSNGPAQIFGVAEGPFRFIDLPAGSVISTATIIEGSAVGTPDAAVAFQSEGRHTLGFYFFNTTEGLNNFGYLNLVVGPSNNGFPVTITDWRYDDSGGAITVQAPGSGAVPEPVAWALMLAGFGGVGAALRRRRPLATTT